MLWAQAQDRVTGQIVTGAGPESESTLKYVNKRKRTLLPQNGKDNYRMEKRYRDQKITVSSQDRNNMGQDAIHPHWAHEVWQGTRSSTIFKSLTLTLLQDIY